MTKKIKYKDVTKKIQLVIEYVTRIKELRIEIDDMMRSVDIEVISEDHKDRLEFVKYSTKLLGCFQEEIDAND